MARNNYKRLCESRLREYAAATGAQVVESWGSPPPAGALVLWDESGVKRLRECVGDGSHGVSDVGSGFTSWSELYGFLDGMCEAERRRERRDSR